jgi:hypothetical protein
MPIVPLEIAEIDPRDILIYDIAYTIGEAVSDPEDIGVLEIAEMIVDQIEQSPHFQKKARIRVKAGSRATPAP